MNKIFFYFFLFAASIGFSQVFPPGAGELGTTAIYKDSSVFLEWGSKVTLKRGPMDISNSSLGLASFGELNDGMGKPDGKVISLGDGGEVIIQFDFPISDGDGPDFAVFENSFNNTFLELAFVEVSSDGDRFVRFPATSLSQNSVQFGNDAIMNPTQLNNLAGKYKASYGTPFDINELKDSLGIDVESITHIKLIDVVGSVDEKYASKDSKNNIINDPFPTPYPSCGFDLDAVGVIHSKFASLKEETFEARIWPNPASDYLYLDIPINETIEITNAIGEVTIIMQSNGLTKMNVSNLEKGIYFLRVKNSIQKILIQ